jgi:hypothetical protein
MAIGFKTGGRKPGIPNKRTLEVALRLENIGCDPIEGMAKLAMDTNCSPELRGKMYSELAQYLYPKRRATELNIEDQDSGALQVTWISQSQSDHA